MNARLFVGPNSRECDPSFRVICPIKSYGVRYLALETEVRPQKHDGVGDEEGWETEEEDCEDYMENVSRNPRDNEIQVFSQPSRSSHPLQLHLGTGDGAGPDLDIFGDSLTCGFLDLETVQFMQHKIDECIKLHAFCQLPASTFAPTRLLDISDRLYPHLISTDEKFCEKYATLSYCWGKDKLPLRTLSYNIKEMMHGISLERMPQTYQDAIHVTYALGLHYLWIDALCIVQDCQDDWVKESQNMGNIYKNSQITIAPIASKSCWDGFIQYRNELVNGRRRQVAQIRSSVKSDPVSSPIFYLLEKLEGTIPLDSTQKDDDPGLWNRRGWTFQEYQLSPRILGFSQYFLHFDCRRGEVTEEGAVSTTLEKYRALFKMRGSDVNPSLGYIDEYSEWYQIISNSYSGRHFTNQSDRLPALTGFAKEWENMINNGGKSDRYVAGLWEKDMPCGLLWRPQSNSSRPLDYASPSWSWASIIGEIYWPWVMDEVRQGPDHKKASKIFRRFRLSKPHYHLTLGRVDIPGTGTDSLVTSASITVSAFLRKMRLNPPSPNHDQGSLEFLDRSGSQSHDNPFQIVLENTLTIISLDVPSEFANAKNVWCCLVASREASGNSSRMNHAGLLLLSVDGNINCFKRFGYFELVWKDKNRNILDYMEKREIVII
ncbi:heterokaryon incompatibility protein-domain-containing protein [Tricladium varicosporioides]|nr:heterokaryon incompatibility protein-domain-containing protein [Hymenoscyphus varicosporioides]